VSPSAWLPGSQEENPWIQSRSRTLKLLMRCGCVLIRWMQLPPSHWTWDIVPLFTFRENPLNEAN